MNFLRTSKKIVAFIGILMVLGTTVVPFFSYAQLAGGGGLEYDNLTSTSVLITGTILNTKNQSIKLGYLEQDNPQAVYRYTQPFALGPNNTVSKMISDLAVYTKYCVVAVDASSASNAPIFNSQVCFTTLPGDTQTAGNTDITVRLDTQEATDVSATLNFTVITGLTVHGLSIRYGAVAGEYPKENGEFFRNTDKTGTTNKATATLQDLVKDTFYYYQVYDTDTKTPYFDAPVKTAPGPGIVLTTGNGVTPSMSPGCLPGQYCLLAPLPGLAGINTQDTSVGKYLGIIFKIGIALAGVLAVVMLVLGGIQYMSTDAFSEKAGGKERMTQAIIGLILVLGAYVILNTLNPNLTIFNLDINKAEITVDPMLVDSDAPQTAPVDGKFCSQYPSGAELAKVFPAPQEADLRATLSNMSVAVSGSSATKPICTTVGQPSCTAVQGLSSRVVAGLQSIISHCPDCELTLTGGSECWLHKSHGPSKDKIDLRNTGTPNFTKYVEGTKNGIPLKGWGTLYVVDGIEFVNEGNHYHIWGWNNDHASSYTK